MHRLRITQHGIRNVHYAFTPVMDWRLNLLINVCLLCGFLVTVVLRPHFLFVVLEWLYGPALLCFCICAFVLGYIYIACELIVFLVLVLFCIIAAKYNSWVPTFRARSSGLTQHLFEAVLPLHRHQTYLPLYVLQFLLQHNSVLACCCGGILAG